MYKPVDESVINKRINDFKARKSPWKTFSKTVAEILTPAAKVKKTARTDISYEALDWNHQPAARAGMRRFAS